MKPENLKSPFSWETRYVTIQDRVWYVPSYYDRYQEFTFPGWNHPDVFTQDRPIRVEYCSGNGAWIAAKAQQDPHSNWVAVEKKFARARKIWSKVKNHRLDNLLVVCGEGHTVTNRYFPESSVSEVFINFPDPWPKTRHAKHRIVQPLFINEITRILKPGHCLTLVTDDPDYSTIMTEVLGESPCFIPCYPAPFYITDLPNYGTSYFEELWRGKGKVIHYHQYRKKEIG